MLLMSVWPRSLQIVSHYDEYKENLCVKFFSDDRLNDGRGRFNDVIDLQS